MRKASISPFEQQNSGVLKAFGEEKSKDLETEEIDQDKSSLSPVKEYRENEVRAGPIKIFKGRDPKRAGKERSMSSSKSIIRLQPTLFGST